MKEVYQLRPVTVADAMSIFKLVNHYAARHRCCPSRRTDLPEHP